MKRFSILAVLALVLCAPNAFASGTNVTLRIAQYDYAAATATCSLSVDAGADGLTVLAAARSAGCIKGYTLQTFGLGHFVDCIDDGSPLGNECGDPAPTYARYWDMRVNCVVTSYGVDDYRAKAGDELSFTFETLVTGTVPAASADHAPTDCTG